MAFNIIPKLMNTSRIIFSFFIICLLMLTASCNGNSNTGLGNDLEISFVENVPPNVIYVEQGTNQIPFEVILQINNRGGFPKEDINILGQLYISGFDKSVVNGRWDGGQASFVLPVGATKSYPAGGMLQKTYLADTINYAFEVQEYPMPIMVTACYYYETFASGITCIDPDPTSANQNEQVCNIGSVSLDSQYGPVKVTSVSQTANTKETIYTIEISNSGSGQVIRQFSQNSGVVTDGNCLNLQFGDKDVVSVEAEIVGLGQGSCTPKGTFDDPVRLFNGKGTVICKFPVDSTVTSAYTTPLQITIRYGYLKSISKEVLLVNTGN